MCISVVVAVRVTGTWRALTGALNALWREMKAASERNDLDERKQEAARLDGEGDGGYDLMSWKLHIIAEAIDPQVCVPTSAPLRVFATFKSSHVC